MADITGTEQSEVVRITGNDEQFAADVVEENDVRKLLVKSETNISSDLRIITEFNQNTTLNDTTGLDIYNETGIITCSGFLVRFNNRQVFVKLTIDGQEIFDIDCEELEDLIDLDQSPQPNIYINWNGNTNTFYFTPNFPLQSSTSVVINIRSAPGESRRYRASLIQVS